MPKRASFGKISKPGNDTKCSRHDFSVAAMENDCVMKADNDKCFWGLKIFDTLRNYSKSES